MFQQRPNQEVRQNQQLRCRFIVLTILAFLVLIFSVTLVLTFSLLSYTGFSSSLPISYYLNKYNNNLTNTLRTMFITSALSILWQIIALVLIFTPLIRTQEPTQQRGRFIYILSNIQVLSAIIPFSKLLAFHIDFNQVTNCQITFVQITITTLLAITATLLLLSLIQFIIIMNIYSNISQQSHSKEFFYKQVINMTNITTDQLLPHMQASNNPINNNPAQHHIAKISTIQNHSKISEQVNHMQHVSIEKGLAMNEQMYPAASRYQSIMNVDRIRQRERQRQKQMQVSMRMERQRWRQMAKEQFQEFRMSKMDDMEDVMNISPVRKQESLMKMSRFAKEQTKEPTKQLNKSIYDPTSLNNSPIKALHPNSSQKQRNFQNYIRKINSLNTLQKRLQTLNQIQKVT